MSTDPSPPPASAPPSRPPSPPALARPRRWPYLVGAGLVALVVATALLPAAPPGGFGARVARFALTAGDLAAVDGGRVAWRSGPGPIDFGRVFAAARTLPGVAAPDDRLAVAFGAPDGSADVVQVTALYDDEADAAALMTSGAVDALSQAFGLTSAPSTLDGADDVRRWTGQDFTGFSFRRGGVVVFVGARGAGAPTVDALAARVRDRVVAAARETAAATVTAATAGP